MSTKITDQELEDIEIWLLGYKTGRRHGKKCIAVVAGSTLLHSVTAFRRGYLYGLIDEIVDPSGEEPQVFRDVIERGHE